MQLKLWRGYQYTPPQKKSPPYVQYIGGYRGPRTCLKPAIFTCTLLNVIESQDIIMRFFKWNIHIACVLKCGQILCRKQIGINMTESTGLIWLLEFLYWALLRFSAVSQEMLKSFPIMLFKRSSYTLQFLNALNTPPPPPPVNVLVYGFFLSRSESGSNWPTGFPNPNMADQHHGCLFNDHPKRSLTGWKDRKSISAERSYGQSTTSSKSLLSAYMT